MRKCIDRIFRKIVARLEDKKISHHEHHVEVNNFQPHTAEIADGEQSAACIDNITQPTLFKEEHPEKFIKEY